MFLKSIEIQGFKSFPDKVLLNFGRGITSIVGPNGSGKSNIVDAIRWVLGEQSVKTLRGGKMEDVIFGGTVKRSPQGFCQVSLIIDNHDRGINTEYDEVEVTRCYYRSGESEFYINRKAVRLKDIHEIFMDTGLGRDGYSVIGQGRIDEILSVKSVDRREIFDEASGISKFRYRKAESENKLASCEENLLRVRDIVSELEGQVEPLREQSEKAKTYLVCRDELRLLEVSVWMDSLDRLKDNLVKVRGDFDNAERMLGAKKDELEKLYAKSEALGEDIHACERREDELRAELREIENRHADVSNRLAVAGNTLKNNEQNISGRFGELSQQEDRGRELNDKKTETEALIKASAEAAEKTCAELSETAAQAEQARLAGEELSAKLAELSARIQAEQARLAGAEAKADAASALEEEIISGSDRAENERRQAAERLAAEQEKSAGLQSEADENEEKRTGALNMLKGFELRLQARTKKVSDLSASLAEVMRTKNSRQDRHRLLSALEREYEGFSQAVRRVMQAKERGDLKGLHSPISSLIETDDKYTLAMEIAFGGSIQDIVADTEEDSKQALNYLKRTEGGRATFRPLSAVKKWNRTRRDMSGERGVFGYADELVRTAPVYRELIGSILGNTVICTDLDCAIALAKKYRYDFRIVTLDGQLINPNGSMTGGSAGRNTGVLSRANELKQLAADIAAAEAEERSVSEALAEAKRDMEASNYQSDVAKEELRSAEDALLRISAEKKQHDLLLSALAARRDELAKTLGGTEERLAELGRQKTAACALIEQINEGVARLETEKQALCADIEKNSGLTAELMQKASVLRESIAASEAEREAMGASVRQLETVLSQMSGDIRSKEEMIAAIRAENDRLKAEAAALRAAGEEHSAQEGEKRKLIEASTADRLRIEGERTKCQKTSQECNNELLMLERERSRLENKKNQTENEENVILDKLWENYELTRATANEIKTELQSLSAANKRIGELRSAIKKLGSVNVDAIDEYTRVSERYNFLTTQRDDLEKAKVDLLKVIEDLTRSMKTIFAEQFKLINEEFGKTFVDIFGGGRALLRLEDENDILNCGIEIQVEMPGKSMRAISLLSGGEKAFVAIALYFAVMKVRPTPFCVLDEIEAALDDVNVTRYVQYMRTLCDKTQFITITHRRGTMEGSDILYGVTMPEQGVTKLLAMNINEIEEKINIKPN